MNLGDDGDSFAPRIPDLATAEVMMTAALGQIDWARRYTLELLAATPRELWFERPTVSNSRTGESAMQLPTHIAWQVGHLAVSQYGLLMFRIHGRRDEDLDLIPSRFRKAYARGSDPTATSSGQCSADELFERLETVHRNAITGLTQGFDTGVLLHPVDMPYAVYPIKLGAILFCPLHEQIHSGQIGLIRRALGLAPVR
ncbi:MAG TPA: DinB family protein [Planctomycetaceae bacterium]|nr:DinB family protein [Planctomycetaceae bacterium]